MNKELEKLEKKIPWLKQFNKDLMKINDVKSLLYYYDIWFKMLNYNKKDDLEIFDLFIKTLNVEKMSNILMVGILRLSFSKRKFLSEWKPLLNSVSNELSKRGENSEEILRGLF